MSDEPTERDVEDMLALRFPKWKQWERDEFANRIEGILAERIAEARREGATAVVDKVTREWQGGTGHTDANKWVSIATLRAALRGDA